MTLKSRLATWLISTQDRRSLRSHLRLARAESMDRGKENELLKADLADLRLELRMASGDKAVLENEVKRMAEVNDRDRLRVMAERHDYARHIAMEEQNGAEVG